MQLARNVLKESNTLGFVMTSSYYDGAVSVMVAVTSQDQRSYIKIECQCNKTAKEILSALQEACGIYALLWKRPSARWKNI